MAVSPPQVPANNDLAKILTQLRFEVLKEAEYKYPYHPIHKKPKPKKENVGSFERISPPFLPNLPILGPRAQVIPSDMAPAKQCKKFTPAKS